MRILIFLSIYVSASAAPARAENQDLTRWLILAKDSKSLAKLISAAETMAVSKSACRLQIKRHALPAACYELLRLETGAGRHRRAAERAKVLGKLDEMCESAADQLKVFDSDSETSPRCRRAIVRARQILAYRRRSPDWSAY